MKKIAYLGMGTMGRGMAANLVKAGHQVTVWNRSPERCADLVARGAKQAATPAEAAAGAELVMYCLSDDAAVEDLVWGAGDLLSAVQPGQIVVDMTTLHPSVSLKEAAAYGAKGTGQFQATNLSDGPEVKGWMLGPDAVGYANAGLDSGALNWNDDDWRGDSMENQFVYNPASGPHYPTPADLGTYSNMGLTWGMGWRGAYLSPPIGPDRRSSDSSMWKNT